MSSSMTYRCRWTLPFFLWGALSFAQKKLDSILEATTIKIYENPNVAIETGTIVFEKATDPKTKISALMLISNAYLSKRENERSLEYALAARNYLPAIANTKSKVNVLNAIGMQHQQLRIYDKAIEYLDEALVLAENLEQKDSAFQSLGYNYAIRGFIYREQMSCEIALNYFNKSIAEYEKGTNAYKTNGNLSTLHYNKGNCLMQLSRIDSARANFEKAIRYAQSVSANSLYAFAKKGLSEVFTAEGNYTQAIEALKKAEKASEEVGDLILNQGIYKNLSENYLALNEHDLYKIYFGKYNDVQNKIAEKEQKTINNSIKNLISENKAATEKKLSRLQKIRWALLAAIVLLPIVWGRIIAKSYRKFKNSRDELETLKE